MSAGSKATALARRASRWLRRGERSAVAMEFGIIAIPFFVIFLGVMEMSYDLYVQAEMDNAVELAARSIQIGAATGKANTTSAAFVASAVCPNLGGLLDCALLTVGTAPIPAGLDYFTLPVQDQLTQAEANSAGGGICTGTAGTMMVLKAWYNGPTFLGLLVPYFASKSPGGATVHLTIASSGFVNEYFPGAGQTSGTACSL